MSSTQIQYISLEELGLAPPTTASSSSTTSSTTAIPPAPAPTAPSASSEPKVVRKRSRLWDSDDESDDDGGSSWNKKKDKEAPASSLKSEKPPATAAIAKKAAVPVREDEMDEEEESGKGGREETKRSAPPNGGGNNRARSNGYVMSKVNGNKKEKRVKMDVDDDDDDDEEEWTVYTGGGGGRVDRAKPARKRPSSGTPITHKPKGEDARDYSTVDFDDEEEEGLLPQLANPPFEDENKPLVLEEGGEGQAVVQVPASANRYLQVYQREGVQFMYDHYREDEGALLGDVMGLGKTIQVICLLLAVMGKTGTREDKRKLEAKHKAIRNQLRRNEKFSEVVGEVVLIILPSSVQDQWIEELRTWGYFEVSKYRGTKDYLEDVIRKVKCGMTEIVVATYAFMLRYIGMLSSVKWRLVIFDEMHILKGHKTKGVEAAKKLEASCIIGLSGTPLQNCLEELLCLLNIVAPKQVPSIDKCSKKFSLPLKQIRKLRVAEAIREKGLELKKELNDLFSSIILTRDKSVIHDKLKGKTDNVVFCPLSNVQREIYERILKLPDVECMRRKDEICDCPDGVANSTKRGKCCHRCPWEDPSDHTRIHPKAVIWRDTHDEWEQNEDGELGNDKCPSCIALPTITKLLKVVNHPSLIQVDPCKPADKQAKELRFAKAVMSGWVKDELGGSYERSNNFFQKRRVEICGKMRAIQVLLERFDREQQKVLLFSYSTQTLDVLEAYAKGEGYGYVRLDGAVPSCKRQELVEQFKRDPSLWLFLISTRAGGLGLNLANATKVIIYDANWNPTHDLQAQDRAFRIGQKEHVEVYRLVVRGTIEEMVYMRQLYKQQVADLALEGLEGKCDRLEQIKARKKLGLSREKNTRETAWFNCIQGVKGEEGELFGLANLLQFSEESFLAKLRASLDPNTVPKLGNCDDELEEVKEGEMAQKMEQCVTGLKEGAISEASAEKLLGLLGVDKEDLKECIEEDEEEESMLEEDGPKPKPDRALPSCVTEWDDDDDEEEWNKAGRSSSGKTKASNSSSNRKGGGGQGRSRASSSKAGNKKSSRGKAKKKKEEEEEEPMSLDDDPDFQELEPEPEPEPPRVELYFPDYLNDPDDGPDNKDEGQQEGQEQAGGEAS